MIPPHLTALLRPRSALDAGAHPAANTQSGLEALGPRLSRTPVTHRGQHQASRRYDVVLRRRRLSIACQAYLDAARHGSRASQTSRQGRRRKYDPVRGWHLHFVLRRGLRLLAARSHAYALPVA